MTFWSSDPVRRDLAAAISAAHAGLKPVIIEKSEYFGGSTAVSGGAIWVPDNPIMRAAGMEDDPKAARRYIELETGNRFNAELVDAFLENGPCRHRLLQQEDCVEDDPSALLAGLPS